ncbi:aspartyl-phosphate phosphatase Spo0E family protein [Paenibacillus gallinarum]|uniref:Aspartyl-phosphate phosphatase Spo0E family protein n=1 Tax=Paenibacillus gallinarum TaxID=2762232 RepID=A0ABR8T687_9BACL|nr:aspartyl-phosphate phosphatase Spo0E family protein [Paenibacillus gallinarum]MBD7971104.1 aspartyl-phosphate phosphatase Spo0E family protein [Paenibacillus gallinarum]
METELLIRIEEERQEMYRLTSLYGMVGPQVVEQSQRLDSLLNLFQSMKEQKSI